jgi:hypothetical protein
LLSEAAGIPEMLDQREAKATLKNPEYIRINGGAVGHYIVNYAKKNHLAALARQVENGQLVSRTG